MFSRIGLRGSLYGLIIVYMASTLPVTLYMLRNYFQSIPEELEEAAMVDGLSRFGVIRRDHHPTGGTRHRGGGALRLHDRLERVPLCPPLHPREA